MSDEAAATCEESLGNIFESMGASRDSGHLFRTLVERTPLGMFLAAIDGRNLFVNRRWSEMSGLAEEDSLGEKWLAAVHPDDRQQVVTRWMEAVSRRAPLFSEYRFVRPDGVIVWVECTAETVQDSDGTAIGYIGNCVDITERKRSAAILVAQSEVLESIANGVALGGVLEALVLIVEEQFPGTVGSILLVDEQEKRLLDGAGPNLPDCYRNAIRGISISSEVGTCSKAAALNQTVITRDIENDPPWRDLKSLPLELGLRAAWSLPIRGKDDKVLGTFGTYFHEVREPTGKEQEVVGILARTAAIAIERHSAQDRLKRLSEDYERRARFYETFFDHTEDIAYVLGLDQRFIYANRALLSLWGKTLEEAVGRNFVELGYEPWLADILNEDIDGVAKHKQARRNEVPYPGGPGAREYEYVFSPIFGTGGEVEAISGITRDITARKKSERMIHVVNELSRKLVTLTTEKDIIHACVETIGTFLDCDRCYFVECFENEDRLEASENWTREGTGSVEGIYTVSQFGGHEWWLAYSSGDCAVEDTLTDPLTKAMVESYVALGVRAYMVQPYKREGLATVVLAATDNKTRLWTTEELRLLETVAARVWPLVQQARIVTALRKSRERMALVADHLPALVAQIDHTGRFLYGNNRCREWFDFPRLQIAGTLLKEVIPKDLYHGRRPQMERALAGELVKFEEPVFHSHLGQRILEVTLVPDLGSHDAAGSFFVMAIDVTEHKQAEASMRGQNERQVLLTEVSRVILNSKNPESMFSEVFKMAHGYLDAAIGFIVLPSHDGETPGLKFGEGITGEELNQIATVFLGTGIDLVPESEFKVNGEVSKLLRANKVRAFAARHLPAGDEKPGFVGFGSRTREQFSADDLELIETISQYIAASNLRFRVLEDLRQSDRRKDRFLATLAHELRNPLAPVLTGVEVIEKSPGDPELTGKVAGMIRRQLGQMVHLIDDLLDLSRINTGKVVLQKERVEISRIMNHAIEASQPLITQFGHRLKLQIPEEPLWLEVDFCRISQVVSNLLSNASKYTPAHGDIVVNVTRDVDESVKISVRDSGEGIDLRSQQRIFEMFEQEDGSRRDGLGIGLTLVKTLLEMHDGSISVQSGGKGKGSDFIARLPLVPSPRATDPSAASGQPGQASQRPPSRVMVVDDGKSTADILALFLEIEGMETALAYDGLQAVELAASFKPHLIFMDLGMPRMDGFAAASEIRKTMPEVILIALSGWGREEDKRRSSEAGFDGHAVKPVTPADLREFLKLLDKPEIHQ